MDINQAKQQVPGFNSQMYPYRQNKNISPETETLLDIEKAPRIYGSGYQTPNLNKTKLITAMKNRKEIKEKIINVLI